LSSVYLHWSQFTAWISWSSQ